MSLVLLSKRHREKDRCSICNRSPRYNGVMCAKLVYVDFPANAIRARFHICAPCAKEILRIAEQGVKRDVG